MSQWLSLIINIENKPKKNAVHTVSEKKSSFKVTKCGLKETDIQKVVRQAEGIGT